VNVVGSIFGYDPADWDRVVRVNRPARGTCAAARCR